MSRQGVQVGQHFQSAHTNARTWVVEAFMNVGVPEPHVRLRDLRDHTVSRIIAVSALANRRQFLPLAAQDG